MSEKVLVVAVHPDDETLGLGGTLLRHKRAGDQVYWVVMTHVQEDAAYSESFKKKRSEEIKVVAQAYQFDRVFQMPFRTARLDTYPLAEIVSALAGILEKVKPTVVYLPNQSDVHSDHRVTFNAVTAITKSFRAPFMKRLLMYETPSETDFAPALQNNSFLPNVFVDISDYLESKLEIMKNYQSELKEHPFPRSLEGLRALATLRGAAANAKYAEAFVLLKEIY